jgi:hypothetical protein
MHCQVFRTTVQLHTGKPQVTPKRDRISGVHVLLTTENIRVDQLSVVLLHRRTGAFPAATARATAHQDAPLIPCPVRTLPIPVTPENTEPALVLNPLGCVTTSTTSAPTKKNMTIFMISALILTSFRNGVERFDDSGYHRRIRDHVYQPETDHHDDDNGSGIVADTGEHGKQSDGQYFQSEQQNCF